MKGAGYESPAPFLFGYMPLSVLPLWSGCTTR